ncbi:putative signal transducing protein [Dongshaea marina]|uniref:putative signal transducing protein n=1 Tax=Dongshaea marina TaxID=2047966 RepID=UPI000D3EA949|nr:DUF2007 domain-containing protein [Dongshaea marina]
MTDQWVVVGRFSFPLDAQIAKGALEAEGIDAFIADEHTINMQWLYSDAMGGVRLMTHPDQAEQARNLLREDHSEAVEELAGPGDYLRCPYCDSSDIEPYTLGKKPAFLVFILLGFPLFFYQPGIRCRQCHRITSLKEYKALQGKD